MGSLGCGGMSAAEERAAWIQGMRQVLDVLESNETIPLPGVGAGGDKVQFFVHGQHLGMTGERLAALVQALGGEGWQQRTKLSASGNITWLEITGHVAGAPIEINADADQVCEPVEPQPVIERHCAPLDAFLAEEQTGGAE
jgi:hypothetical protein